jgi:hypothetical protein
MGFLSMGARRELRVLLVTGAPRTATSPVGAALALAPGTTLLYEPMGPTGDVRIPSRFAVPGQPGFSLGEFNTFLADLKAMRLDLRPQVRRSYSKFSHTQRLIRLFTGSRTRLYYWRAKLSTNLRTVIWKDPMAALAVPAVLAAGVPTLLCLRNPLAHAASFKRKGWRGDIASIYPNFQSVYGALPGIERLLASRDRLTSVESASLLWHMIYSIAQRIVQGEFGALPAKLFVISGTALEANEIEVYRQAYYALGLTFEGRPRQSLESRARRAVKEIGDPRRTHNWGRSISTTNSYWSSVLTEGETAFVSELNAGIFASLESASDEQHAIRL